MYRHTGMGAPQNETYPLSLKLKRQDKQAELPILLTLPRDADVLYTGQKELINLTLFSSSLCLSRGHMTQFSLTTLF